MKQSSLYSEVPIQVFQAGKLTPKNDVMVNETELTIVLNGTELVVLACSPCALEELAIGYLLAEGILNTHQQLKSVEVSDGQVQVLADVDMVKSNPAVKVNTCLGRSQSSTHDILPLSDEGNRFCAYHLLTLVEQLNERSYTFKKTGGTHSAGLGQADTLMTYYEDIGRHNAVDKALGYAFKEQITVSDKCLVLSGRIAGEILYKAARSRIGLVLSRSAPTSKSIELAKGLGITIVGFARGDRFNVYTHAQRVVE